MAVTCDPEHKFDLALQLGDLKIAYQLAKESEVCFCSSRRVRSLCSLLGFTQIDMSELIKSDVDYVRCS